MPAARKAVRRTAAKVALAAEFVRTREMIRRFCVLPDAELDVTTVWVMGTWTFSPSCTNPATYPYLYVTAAKGSGKTVLGQDVFGVLCRSHQATVGITGPALFRMLGSVDEETGDVIPLTPTLALDEIDASYSGAKDESLRQMLNAGYKRGATVPRAMGKTTISYPVYCPKVLMGIDNGHLPDTVVDRSIRIELKKAKMGEYEPFYIFEVEDEAAELSQQLSDWAKRESDVLREYRPEAIPDLSPRQWEIARSLVQLAHSIGNENQIREAIHELMTRNPERPDNKVRLYGSILHLFDATGEDRVTTKMILAQLDADGISVPGGSGKGLAAVLSEDGVAPDYIRLRPEHPGVVDGKMVQRGYFRHKFDGPFIRYIEDES